MRVRRGGKPCKRAGDDGVVAVTCTANGGGSLWSHAERRDRTTQFHGADQQVINAPGFPPGEEPTLSRYYTSHWNDGWFGGKFVWSHRFQNMIILLGFILFFRFATFYALERINYSTR